MNSHHEQQQVQKKILVVDDEPDLTKSCSLALEDHGFKVDTFNDPLEALSNYKPDYYDLVILDIKMPKMDGFQLYNEIKKKGFRTTKRLKLYAIREIMLREEKARLPF